MQVRNWLQTLWPASYKGLPFYFESDEEEGGRGLVIHKFPNRDDPYVEDLGEEPRFFDGHAYVIGDDADRAAIALSEMFASRGVGTLVVPIRGPVPVHCHTFRRTHEKDRLGFISFRVRFVREGAATALISIPYLAGQGFAAAAAMVSAAAVAFARTVRLSGAPDFVVAAAVGGIDDALVAIEAARLSEPLAPEASARLRDAIEAVHARVPDLIARAEPDADMLDAVYAAIERYADRPNEDAPQGPLAAGVAVGALARGLADALAADSAARVAADLVSAFAVVPSGPYLSRTGADAEANAAAARRMMRLSALAAFAEALIRRSYAARPDGVSARGEASARFDAELSLCTGAEDATLYRDMQTVRARVVEYLTRLIADLAPVQTVEAQQRMPSLWWSWRLYADPLRAGELVRRNAVPHPSFMPTTFQALAR